MADMVTAQELENAKIDARTIGESVNENKIVTPRYGAPFKSMPMIAEEMQSVIGTIIAGGVPASIVADANGLSQQQINDNNESALSDRYTKSETNSALLLKANQADVDSSLALKADKSDTFTKSEVSSLVLPKADTAYVDAAVGAISTDASKQYATLASISLNQNIFISEAENGGYWYKATAGATSLTKSPYDPLAKSKDFANANPLFKPKNYSLVNYDLNEFTQAGVFVFNNSPEDPEISKNFPFYGTSGWSGTLYVMGAEGSTIVRQMYITATTMFFRTTTSGTFGNWKKLTSEADIMPLVDVNPIYKPNNFNNLNYDLNNYTKAGITVFNNSPTNAEVSKNFPKYGSGNAGTLFVMAVKTGEASTNNVVRQMYITATEAYFRTTTSGLFNAWKKLLTSDDVAGVTIFNASSAAIDFHNLTSTAEYAFTTMSHLALCTNAPPELAIGFLKVERVSSTAIIQTYKCANGRIYVKRLSTTWGDWLRTDSGKDLNTATFSKKDAALANSYLFKDGNTLKKERDIYPSWYDQTNAEIFTSHQVLYDMYDALVTDFPEIVTRETIGYSVNNNPIHCYTINPPSKRYTESYSGKKPQKIVVQSFIHGAEHSGALGVYGFFDNLLRMHRQLDDYSILRTSFQYKVVPIANPDGVDLKVRYNANGADLNRDWIDFAQPETRALRDYYLTQTDAYLFLDSHSHDEAQLWWVASNNNYDLIEYVGDELLSYSMRHFVPNKPETAQYVWLAPSINTNTFLSYMTSQGANAVLIENTNSTSHALLEGSRIGMRKIAVQSILTVIQCALNVYRNRINL